MSLNDIQKIDQTKNINNGTIVVVSPLSFLYNNDVTISGDLPTKTYNSFFNIIPAYRLGFGEHSSETVLYGGGFYRIISGVSGGGGGEVVSFLSGLTDVSITSPINKQLLQYNGSEWINYNSNFIVQNPGATDNIISPTGNFTPIVISGHSSQTQPLTKWITSSGTTAGLLSNVGGLVSHMIYTQYIEPKQIYLFSDVNQIPVDIFSISPNDTDILRGRRYDSTNINYFAFNVSGNLSLGATSTYNKLHIVPAKTQNAIVVSGTPNYESSFIKIVDNTNNNIFHISASGTLQVSAKSQTADSTISLSKLSPSYQFINPNNVDRDVNLPTVVSGDIGLFYTIQNSAPSGVNTLTVKNAGGTSTCALVFIIKMGD